MTQGPISRIKYHTDDEAFVLENFGLIDPTPGDGQIQWDEITPELQKFYKNLSEDELKALRRYKLKSSSFGASVHLAHVARKFIRWEYAQQHFIPEQFDETLFEGSRVRPEETDQSIRLFEQLTINVGDIVGHERIYRLLKDRSAEDAHGTTFVIFTQFLEANEDESQVLLTREQWNDSFHNLDSEQQGKETAESTWNDLLSMWQFSKTAWSPLMNDQVAGRVLGGFIRYGSGDLFVSVKGVKSLLKDDAPIQTPLMSQPRFVMDGVDTNVDTYPFVMSLLENSSVDQMSIRSDLIWPDTTTQIPLMSQLGVSLNLVAEPGARLILSQDIRNGGAIFDVSRPLFIMDGFDVNVDTHLVVTRWLADQGQGATDLIDKDFDVEFENLFAITVYNDRLCFVFESDIKEHGSTNNIYDPNPNDDFLFVDVTQAFKGILDAADPSKAISQSIINKDGDVRPSSQLQLTQLQDAVQFALQYATPTDDTQEYDGWDPRLMIKRDVARLKEKISSTWQSAIQPPPLNLKQFNGIRSEVYVNDIRMNMTGFLPDSLSLPSDDNLIHIDHAVVSGGYVTAQGVWPETFCAQGRLDMNLGLDAPYLDSGSEAPSFLMDVRFEVDTEHQMGYAVVNIPQVWVDGFSPSMDGEYSGDVYVNIDPEIFATLKEDPWDPQKWLRLLQSHILADIQKEQQEYLAASVYFTYQQTAEDVVKARDLMTTYQLAFAEGDKELFGVIQGGEFSVIEMVDGQNEYLSREFLVSARQAVTGGFSRLWGQDVAIEVSQDQGGTLYFRPRYAKGQVQSFYDVGTQNMTGDLVAVPVFDSRGGVKAYDITIKHLELDIMQAEIEFRNNKKLIGKTKAVIDQGQWQVEANSIFDLFVSGNDWIGQGTLHLVNMDNRVALVDTVTGAEAHFETDRLDTDLSIRLLRFNPVSITGSLMEIVDRGVAEVDSDQFWIQSDVSGGIGFRNVEHPVMAFEVNEDLEVPDGLLTETLDQKESLVAENVQDQGVAEETEVDVEAIKERTFRPYLDRLDKAGRSIFDQIKFDVTSPEVVQMAESLVRLEGTIEGLKIYSEAVYDENLWQSEQTSSFPLIRGFLKFLNPRIKEGTELHIPNQRQIITDGKLHYDQWHLNQPVGFLGKEILGFDVAKPESSESLHHSFVPILKTKHGHMNPIKMLKLLFCNKMKGFYERVDKLLLAKHQIEGVEHISLGKNEVPLDLGDMALFFVELARTLDWDHQWERIYKREFKPFLKQDFKDIPEEQVEGLEEDLLTWSEQAPIQENKPYKGVITLLNDLGRDPELAKRFTPEFVDQVFEGDVRLQVLDIIETIDLIKGQMAGPEMTPRQLLKLRYKTGPEEQALDEETLLGTYQGRTIQNLNYKLLRLYAGLYLKKPLLIDLNLLDRLQMEGDLIPKQLDTGLVAIQDDHDEIVSFELSYNPSQRDQFDVVYDEGTKEAGVIFHDQESKADPYLSFKLGGEGQELHGIDTDFANRSIVTIAHFDHLSGIELYLDGPVYESDNMLMRIDRFRSAHDLEVLHRPEGMDGPAFAILTRDPDSDENHSTFMEGGNMFLGRQDGYFIGGVDFDHTSTDEGVLYITSRDEKTGELQDGFIRQKFTEYDDFDIRLGLKTVLDEKGNLSYSFEQIKVIGDVLLSKPPEVESDSKEIALSDFDNTAFPTPEPRAYFFLGTNAAGEREYVELRRMEGQGHVEVVNEDMSFSGDIELESEIPSQVFDHPVMQSLSAKGIQFDLDSLQIQGSFEFNLDGGMGGRISQMTSEDASQSFDPTELVVKGDISFMKNGHRVTVTDLRVPIQNLDIKLAKISSPGEPDWWVPILRDFQVEGGDAITADVSAQVELPVKVGSGMVGIDHASFSLVSESGIDFGMVDPWNMHLNTDGLRGELQDSTHDNSVVLTAQSIRIDGDQGEVNHWAASGEFGELVRGILTLAFSGDLAQFRMKNLSEYGDEALVMMAD